MGGASHGSEEARDPLAAVANRKWKQGRRGEERRRGGGGGGGVPALFPAWLSWQLFPIVGDTEGTCLHSCSL